MILRRGLKEILAITLGILGYRAVSTLVAPFALGEFGAHPYGEILTAEAISQTTQVLAGGYITFYQTALMSRREGSRAPSFWLSAAVMSLVVPTLLAFALSVTGKPLAWATAANATALGLNALWVLRVQARLGLYAFLTVLQSLMAAAVLILAINMKSAEIYLLAQPVSVIVVSWVAIAKFAGRPHLDWRVFVEALPMLPMQVAVALQLSAPLLVVARMTDPASAAIYGTITKLQFFALAASSIITQFLAPRIDRFDHNKTIRYQRTLLLLSLPVLILILLCVWSLSRTDIVPYATNPWLVALILSVTLIPIVNSPSRLELLAESPRRSATAQLLGAVALIATAFPLTAYFGPIGAGLSLYVGEGTITLLNYLFRKRDPRAFSHRIDHNEIGRDDVAR